MPFISLLALLLTLALAVPGLTLGDRTPMLLKDKADSKPRSRWVNLTGSILVIQAVIFLLAEKLVFEQGEMYASSLVLFTSALGMLLTTTQLES